MADAGLINVLRTDSRAFQVIANKSDKLPKIILIGAKRFIRKIPFCLQILKELLDSLSHLSTFLGELCFTTGTLQEGAFILSRFFHQERGTTLGALPTYRLVPRGELTLGIVIASVKDPSFFCSAFHYFAFTFGLGTRDTQG
jgi:hypothetical protein